MANTKISALTALTGANLATDDQFAVVDTSAAATKSITVAELKLGIMPAPGPIGATTPSTGAFTSLNATGLAVNGTLNIPGGNWAQFNSANTLYSNAGVGFFLQAPDVSTTPLSIRGSSGAVWSSFSSTGLAVTGTISTTGIVTPGTFTTGTRPAKTLGGIIFDTTLNKLLIGGVSAWEVVTSI